MIFRDFVLDDFVHGKFIECFILSVQNSELKAIDCHFKNHCFKGKYVPHSKAWKWNLYQFAISSKAWSYCGHFQLHKQFLKACGSNCGLSHVARNCEWSCMIYLKIVISKSTSIVKMKKLSMWRFSFFLTIMYAFSIVFNIKIETVVVCCAHPMRIKNI